MLGRVFIITDLNKETGYAYICEQDGPSEAEVWTSELEPADRLELHTVTGMNCRQKLKTFIVYNPETDSFWYAIEGTHTSFLSKGKPFKSGQQVEAYMKEHPEVESYVILDDEDRFFPEQKEHLVLVDSDTGLTETDVTGAIKILK